MSETAAVRRTNDDRDLDSHIGILLRVGMYSSAFVVLAGGILYLVQHGHDRVDYRSFAGVAPRLKTIGGIMHGAAHGDSSCVIQAGLLLLIATPIARVIFSVFAFLHERDYLYVGISLLVLAVLMYSVIYH